MKTKNLKKDAGELIAHFIYTLEIEKFWEKPHDVGEHWIGRKHYRDRLKRCIEWAAQNYDGDFIEIGAHHGKTAVAMAEIAKKYNRKVIVIDPWSGATEDFDGALDCFQGDEYDIWCKNTEEYSDVIELYRMSSNDSRLPAILKEKQLCFAWIDGSHTTKALKNDLNLVKHCKGIISVDDISYWLWCDVCDQRYNLLGAFNTFCKENSFQKLKLDWIAEGYIFCGHEGDILTPEFLGDNWPMLSQIIEKYSSVSVASYRPDWQKFVWLPCTILFDNDGVGIGAMPENIGVDNATHVGPPKEECCE